MRHFSPIGRWVFALCLLQSAFALQAQAIEADALREKLVESINLSAALAGPKSLNPRSYDSLVVEPDGERFRVTITGLRILLDPQQDAALLLPSVGFTMAPEAGEIEDDLFRVTDLVLPEQVSVSVPEEVVTGKVETTGLHLDVLWSFALQYYREMDSRIESTSIYDAEGTRLFSMGPATATMSTQPRDGGNYDVSMTAQYSDVGLHVPPAAMAIDHGRAAMEWRGMNLVAYEQIFRKMQSTAPEEEEFAQFYARQMQHLMVPEMWEGEGDALFEGDGLRALDPSGVELFGLDSFGVRFGTSDLAAPLARMNMRVNHKGLRLTPAFAPSDGLYGDLVPEEMALSVIVDKMPMRMVITQLFGFLSEELMNLPAPDADSDTAQGEVPDALLPMLADLQTLVLSSGASIAINDSHYKSSAAEVTLDGQFNLDQNAVFAGWGSLLAEITGLDNLMGLARQQMESADPAEMEAAAGALGMLSMLQVFSNRTLVEGGEARDSYKVELNPAGEIKVNDQLLMGAQ